MQSSPTFNISMAQAFNSSASKLSVRNHRSHSNSPTNHASSNDAIEWVRRCKQILIDMESKNIKTRAIFWTQFVNDATNKAMEKLHGILTEIGVDYKRCPAFKFHIDDPEGEHLKFLSEWTGLKTQQMQYMPKSYTEFEYKAKNWLNGRKAPNYAQTLFPKMIHDAEAHAERISAIMFATPSVSRNLLSTALRFGYLAKLCSAKISLNDTGRKTPLLIENSIKTAKSKTSKIFQQYAVDHPYSSQFPSHTSEAAQYFETKYADCLNRFVAHIKDMQNGNALNSMPPIPLQPAAPHIPSLSDASVASNENNNHHAELPPITPNTNNSNSVNLGKFSMDSIPPPTTVTTPSNTNGIFAFSMPSNSHSFTVSDLHSPNPLNAGSHSKNNSNNNNNMVSPGSSNSTFNSTPFNMNSPSTASNTTPSNNNGGSSNHGSSFNLLSPNSGNVVLSSLQYHNLMQQLDRLTSTQKEQKSTITQLVTRLHSLEQVIDTQRTVISQQFPLAGGSVSEPFWGSNLAASGSQSGGGTPSCGGYSLAQDFANAHQELAAAGKPYPHHPATSIISSNGTPTLTTNSSTNTPHSPHTPSSALYNYLPLRTHHSSSHSVNYAAHSQLPHHGAVANHDHDLDHHDDANDDDMEMREHHKESAVDSEMSHHLHVHDLGNNSSLPVFANSVFDSNDLYSSNPNINMFPNYI